MVELSATDLLAICASNIASGIIAKEGDLALADPEALAEQAVDLAGSIIHAADNAGM